MMITFRLTLACAFLLVIKCDELNDQTYGYIDQRNNQADGVVEELLQEEPPLDQIILNQNSAFELLQGKIDLPQQPEYQWLPIESDSNVNYDWPDFLIENVDYAEDFYPDHKLEYAVGPKDLESPNLLNILQNIQSIQSQEVSIDYNPEMNPIQPVVLRDENPELVPLENKEPLYLKFPEEEVMQPIAPLNSKDENNVNVEKENQNIIIFPANEISSRQNEEKTFNKQHRPFDYDANSLGEVDLGGDNIVSELWPERVNLAGNMKVAKEVFISGNIDYVGGIAQVEIDAIIIPDVSQNQNFGIVEIVADYETFDYSDFQNGGHEVYAESTQYSSSLGIAGPLIIMSGLFLLGGAIYMTIVIARRSSKKTKLSIIHEIPPHYEPLQNETV